MYADDGGRAVCAVRGGCGCARILPYLDCKAIAAHPKLLIGFSDITALHLAFSAHAGFTTIHGPNAASSWGELSRNGFRTLAFEGGMPTYRNPQATDDRLVQTLSRPWTHRPRHAPGRARGGALSIPPALGGAPSLS